MREVHQVLGHLEKAGPGQALKGFTCLWPW